MTRRCPACGSADLDTLLTQEGVPAQSNVLFPTREEALNSPTGNIRLVACQHCGFIANVDFDPTLAPASNYEASQAASARFREYARGLAQTWIERHGLRGQAVLEIGCGSGDFIEWMVELGAGRGIGVDPLLGPERLAESTGQLSWVPEHYAARHLEPDVRAIVCRHTLEHIGPVQQFVSDIRASIPDGQQVTLLFEVPDIDRILEEVAFWDVYYEHAAYFSVDSLRRLFEGCGFRVERIDRVYDDQYLVLDATPAAANAEPAGNRAALDAGLRRAERFRGAYDSQIARLRHQFDDYAAAGKRVAVWGAGSKATAYLFALGAGSDAVACVVDINPQKQGMFIAGSGHPIVGPDDLAAYEPDIVIAMNSIYRDEIRRDLDARGIDAELTTA